MRIIRILGYIFIFAVVLLLMIINYPLKNDVFGWSTLVLFVIGPILIGLIASNRAIYHISIDNVYVVCAWLSMILLMYLTTLWGIYSGAAALLYLVFVVLAVTIIGLLNLDKAKYILLQIEPQSSLSFMRGVAYGVLSWALAMIVVVSGLVSSASLVVGPVSAWLKDLVGLGIEYLIMLFLIAIPEELMARVFCFKFGSAVLDVYTSALVTLVSGYSLHAITRYSLDYASLVLFIITLVWLIFTIAYVRHGFLAAISAHATYNILISAVEYGLPVLVVAIIIAMIPILYMYKRRISVL